MTTILPEHVLKLVAPEDRAKLGKAGLTASEVRAKWDTKNERQLQKDVLNFLHLKGIDVFYQRMDKRTRGRVGQPDFLFAFHGFACAWELKHGDGRLSQEQATMLQRLSTLPNAWQTAVIRSVNDAIAFLKEFEL